MKTELPHKAASAEVEFRLMLLLWRMALVLGLRSILSRLLLLLQFLTLLFLTLLQLLRLLLVTLLGLLLSSLVRILLGDPLVFLFLFLLKLLPFLILLCVQLFLLLLILAIPIGIAGVQRRWPLARGKIVGMNNISAITIAAVPPTIPGIGRWPVTSRPRLLTIRGWSIRSACFPGWHGVVAERSRFRSRSYRRLAMIL
jgi:hypothetical protein